MRRIKKIYAAPAKHWVGDGFHVSSLFSHMDEIDKQTSPFLMLDYGIPEYFAPNNGPAHGVGQHPHAGFETVTLALQGEIAHRDSAGHGGVIGTGDAQWMTAGHGIVHEEFHSEAFSQRGGEMEMLQFWVNLPKKFKSTPPAYQSITSEQIPVIELGGGSTARIVAGSLNDVAGPAKTFTPVDLWEIDIPAGQAAEIEAPKTHNLMLVPLRGDVVINGENKAKATELVVFELEDGKINLTAGDQAVKLAVFGGEPINEPVVGYGPFVMNTKEEIIERVS